MRTRKLSGGRCELLDFSEVYFDSILLLKYKLILAVYLSCGWVRVQTGCRHRVSTNYSLFKVL